MPPETQDLFVEGYRDRAKSVPSAYGFWFLGLHYAYLGDWFLQVAFWASWVLVLPGFIWWLADSFRTQGLTRKYNEGIAEDVLANITRARESTA